jgi:cytochrome oxidase Cu insertion factor (SCO1/SenC/PrrC family)
MQAEGHVTGAVRPAGTTTGRRGKLWQPRHIALVVATLAALACAVMVLTPRSASPAAASPLAPDFTLPAVAGASGAVSLSSLRGHPVVINFFNSHCIPCLGELPELRTAARTYAPKGVLFLGVATGGDTLASAHALALAEHLPYRVVVDVHQAVAWRYYVGGWPTSFFVDAQGRLHGEYVGPLDSATLRSGLAQIGAISCKTCTPLPQASLLTDQPAAGVVPAINADFVYATVKPAPFFALRDQNGKRITPQSFHGKVVALTFISSVCIEQCPLVGKGLTLIRGELGKEASKMAIVAISVSPEQDSPAATQRFASSSGWQNTNWHYLTAPRSVLAPIWKRYGVYVAALPPIYKSTVSVQHEANVFLIDPSGKLRALYDVPFLPSRVASTVKALLAAPQKG